MSAVTKCDVLFQLRNFSAGPSQYNFDPVVTSHIVELYPPQGCIGKYT